MRWKDGGESLRLPLLHSSSSSTSSTGSSITTNDHINDHLIHAAQLQFPYRRW